MQQTNLDDLRALLTQVRRRWMTARSTRAAVRAAVVALALLLLVLAIDRFLQPPDVPMVALAVVALAIAAAYAVRTLWPLHRVPGDRQVARFIEERCPDLEDRLASAAEVVDGGRPSAFGDLVLVDAAAKARAVEIDQVVARRDVRRSVVRGVAATAALLVVLVVGIAPVGRIVRTAWLYALPYSAVLEVEPGDTRVVAGQPLRIHAAVRGTFGAPARSLPVVAFVADDGIERTAEMRSVGDGFEIEIPAVVASFTYRVRAATLTSDAFDVTALFAPQVEQIDVTYRYPPSTGLPPRVETNGGDIYAPLGTRVSIAVRMDKPVVRGSLDFTSGGRLLLQTTDARTLETTFEVSMDDTYRVSVVDEDGLASPADVDYFIRTVFDRPPEIEIVRPGGDRDITPLEEVVIEARADDDFGLERFELVYAVIGQAERAIDLRGGRRTTNVRGSHTVYGEDLELKPGDFISYYARARDTNTSRQASLTRSDIYFLQVRPFGREFEEVQSQSVSAMDAGEVGNLAEVQKDIIVATWRLDRQRRRTRSVADMKAVADAQAELKDTAVQMAARLIARGREMTPETRGRPAAQNEAMAKAVEAMGTAEASLRAGEVEASIPPEMEALNQLLKAQAEIRRRQVALQQGNQGSPLSANRAQEDLSALFDRELRRDQQTNYEDRSSAADEPDARDQSDALRRLRELAQRQEALNREQRELAQQAADLDAADVARQLDRLTREQNELRQRVEDLRRELARMQAPESGGSQADQQGMNGIAEQMRHAMSELRRGDVSEAARRSQAALDRLQELQRRLEGQTGVRRRQALGELQLEAQRLARRQRQMASDTRHAGADPASRETRYRLAAEEDQLAARVDSLEDRIADLTPRGSGREREALASASAELDRGEVADRMRELADQLRRTTSPVGSEAAHDAVARIADADDDVADTLERVAGRLAATRQQSATAQRLSDELQEAQALRRRLEQIEQRLERLARADRGSLPEDRQAVHTQDIRPGGDVIQPGGDPQPSPNGRPIPQEQQRGIGAGGGLAELQKDLARQLAESPELLAQLSRQRPTLEQDLERWATYWQSGPAPGTEAFKQDYSAWQSLRDDVELALEQFEASRSRELTAEETGDRANVGPTEEIPEEYRRVVEEYYRSLASGPDRP